MPTPLPTLSLDDIKTEYADGRPVVAPSELDDAANGENNGQHQQKNISREEL